MNTQTNMTASIAAAFWVLAGCAADDATNSMQRQSVLNIVKQAAMAQINRDETAWNALTTPNGVWYVQSIDSDWQSTLSYETAQSKFSKPTSVQPGTVEHYWNEQIMLDGPVASFWAPYARQVGEEVKECGTVSATLVKIDSTWRVASSTRTKRSFLCQEYRARAR